MKKDFNRWNEKKKGVHANTDDVWVLRKVSIFQIPTHLGIGFPSNKISQNESYTKVKASA